MSSEPVRRRGHIAWSTVEGRLISTRSMIVSTTRLDGRPHAAPVWYWWNGAERIYFTTTRGSHKARNLAHQPWAVVHFGNGDDVCFADGPVSIVADRDEQQAVDKAYAEKYVDPKSGRRWSIFNNPEDDLYRIDAKRIVTWMYGNAGGWTEWRFGSEAT